MLAILVFLACGKKAPTVARPEGTSGVVEDLGNGALRLDTVVFEGVQINKEKQEQSLEKVAQPKKKYGDIEQYWEPLEEVEELVDVFNAFIQYEYTEDDEANSRYLVEEKMKIFHQLTASAYDIVMAERNYYEVSAGIYIAGATELRYAEMWNRYPTPEDLDHSGKVVFGERVRDTVDHLGEEGKDKLQRIIHHYFRSMVSGEYTLAALQELQWRFPQEYPRPVSVNDATALQSYHHYSQAIQSDAIPLARDWNIDENQQLELMFRLEDSKQLWIDIQTECGRQQNEFRYIGSNWSAFCELRELLDLDLLLYQYPAKNWSPKLKQSNQHIEGLLRKHLGILDEWSDSEYDRFWRKEAQIILREYQIKKMNVLRKTGRRGWIPSLSLEIWNPQTAETMDQPTANILDAHVNQLERLIRIMNYDCQTMDFTDRSDVIRKLYFTFPETLQELEFFAQALFFAFPEDPAVRARVMISLLEGYSHYLPSLLQLETEESKDSIVQIKAMNESLVLGFVDIIQTMSIDSNLQKRVEESKQRLEAVYSLTEIF